MQFMLVIEGWRASFLEQDLKTSLRRTFVFQDQMKISDMARHGGINTPK